MSNIGHNNPPADLPEFDGWGRMKYNPEIHKKHKTSWTYADEKYLIENYEKIGAAQLSFELERTIGVIMTRACALRNAGKMPKRTSKTTFKRWDI